MMQAALLEWDWRLQDGIGTPRDPVSYAVAIDRLFARGDALIDEILRSDKDIPILSVCKSKSTRCTFASS